MGFFSPPKPPPPPPPPPTPEDPAVDDARRKARQTELKRRGLGSTLLTGGQGEDESKLNIGTKTLLGQ